MSIINRIVDLLKKNGASQADICNYIGIKYNVFTTWKTRETDPPAKYLVQICEFLNISLEYLLTGEEKSSPTVKMTADERELLEIYNNLSPKSQGQVKERAIVLAELEAPAANDPEQEHEEEPETIFIEYSTLKVSAGSGEPLIDDTYPEFIEVKRSELTEEANFAVQISGNSMLPRFKNKDIVLVRSQPTVEIGEIGIFIIDGNGYIKERAANRLISINPEYDDIFFKENQDIRCKGLVIGTLEEEDFV